MKTRSRTALTPVELVVLLAILGVLMGLLLPGVVKARLAAVQAQRQNNLKQFGTAVHFYHDTWNAFPSPETAYPFSAPTKAVSWTAGEKGSQGFLADYGFASALSADKYAAVAYSTQTDAYGYSYDYDSEEEAENAAVEYCNSDGCKAVGWVTNGCIALASGEDSYYGYGWGDNLDFAKNRAMKECRSRTTGCRQRCWACTSGYAP